MPLYSYKCSTCGKADDLFRRIKQRNHAIRCPLCHGKMSRVISLPSTDNKDYAHEILSVAMGVDQSQVAEHRRLYPGIPMTDTGEIRIRNVAEERKITKILAHAFSEK